MYGEGDRLGGGVLDFTVNFFGRAIIDFPTPGLQVGLFTIDFRLDGIQLLLNTSFPRLHARLFSTVSNRHHRIKDVPYSLISSSCLRSSAMRAELGPLPEDPSSLIFNADYHQQTVPWTNTILCVHTIAVKSSPPYGQTTVTIEPYNTSGA
jgi:hypothetical protein